MFVRFEVDAFIPTATGSGTSGDAAMDNIIDSFGAASLTSFASQTEHGLAVQHGGSEIASSQIVELTTRTVRNKNQDWMEHYCQLFFSQTAFHFLAFHDNGWFEQVEKRDLSSSEDFKRAESSAQDHMKVLLNALGIIRKMVMAQGKEGRLSLICDGGVLKVYEREDEEGLLPEPVMRLFARSEVL